MSGSLTPYLFAVCANICFGTASISFSRFAKSHSASFINQLKVSIAFVCFVIAFFLFEHYAVLSFSGNAYLLSSGFIGLCVGDLFLFRALANLGPSRTLILYSFQPFLLATYGYLFLGQTLSNQQVFAIFCMMACVFTFVWERNRSHGKFEFLAFFTAFLGIFFDAVGVMLSRQAYEGAPELGTFQVNATRAAGALIGFLLIRPSSFARVFREVKALPPSDQKIAVGASFLGTFISLSFYLQALKTAHVASLSAISITLPIWASLIEHVKLKKWPSPYLWCAFSLFLIGFVLMNAHFS
jgi:drug/metabolite transporter (DMT)-like permease